MPIERTEMDPPSLFREKLGASERTYVRIMLSARSGTDLRWCRLGVQDQALVVMNIVREGCKFTYSINS